METYKSECRKLLDWASAEDKKIHEEVKASGFIGFDGPGVEKHKKISEEYYRRLAELKKKYGKNTDSASITTQESDFTAESDSRYASL